MEGLLYYVFGKEDKLMYIFTDDLIGDIKIVNYAVVPVEKSETIKEEVSVNFEEHSEIECPIIAKEWDKITKVYRVMGVPDRKISVNYVVDGEARSKEIDLSWH